MPRLLVALLLAVPIAVPAWTQTVPVRTLSQSEAIFHHGFTRVGGVQELSNGTVIVLDVSDATVQAIDSTWTTMWQVGRHGAGPCEYRTPTILFALSGDSSAVYDPQNMRMLVITPEGDPGDFLKPLGSAGEPIPGYAGLRTNSAGIMLHTATVSDGAGYFYAKAPPIVPTQSGTLEFADSAAIERWSMSSPTRDTVGFMPRRVRPGCRIMAGSISCPPLERPRAFSSIDQWAVASDGRVAIVFKDPYRVKYLHPTGHIVEGEPIPYEPIRVTERHKQLYREAREQRGQALVVSSDGRSATVPHTPKRIDWEWPRYLPPFIAPIIRTVRYPAVRFAQDGMLWIHRTVRADQPPKFDVVDAGARVVAQVRLPPQRRLVGFGVGVVYLVRIDEFDLEYLERYRVP